MTFRESLTTHALLTTVALAGSLAVATSAAAQSSTPASAATAAAPARSAAPSPDDGQAATPDQLFIRWDRDKNKMLSLDEFKNGWESAREQNIIGRLESQFRAADKDKSGLIEVGEFANLALIKRSGSGAPPMSAFDTNKDQKLDFKEFLEMVPTLLKRLAPANKQ